MLAASVLALVVMVLGIGILPASAQVDPPTTTPPPVTSTTSAPSTTATTKGAPRHNRAHDHATAADRSAPHRPTDDDHHPPSGHHDPPAGHHHPTADLDEHISDDDRGADHHDRGPGHDQHEHDRRAPCRVAPWVLDA